MSKSTSLLVVLIGIVAGTAIGSGLLILSNPANARQAGTAASAGEVKTATATVEAVDKEKRTLKLRTEDGKSRTVDVPEDVKAFDRIKKGDRIRLSYQESMALAVHRPGEARPEDQIKETTQQIEGARPGRMIERKQTISGEIVSVDTKRNVVKVKGPDGKVHEITVEDPSVRERIKDLKPGEVVQVTYTEAMAVSLEPAAK